MSTALAIASITSALKSLLENRLVEIGAPASVGDVTVTALPPDRITTGADERSQLNLFLYRVSPNTRWRRSPEKSAQATSPLALDLHYLLTAYGEQDLHAEILLGYGMQLLHEVSVLSREQIEAALARLNGARGSAQGSDGLTEPMEQISVTPEFSGTEDISRLWSALQARYRPSAAYKVSMVLIDAGETHAPQRSAEPAPRSSPQARRR
jgi:hypothetical protein